MAKVDTFKETVSQLVDALGGVSNIKEVAHCATRFRVIVNDDSKVDKSKLENVEKAKGFSKEGQQWQIIFGAGIVNKVFDKYQSMYNTNSSSSGEETKKKSSYKWNPNYSWQTNLFTISRNVLRSFADIFIPLIPLFIAGGLSLALNSLIKVCAGDSFDTNGAAKVASFIFDTIGGAILGSLPVLIGYTSAKKFGGTPWFGAAIGLVLIAPGLVNSYTLNAEQIHWYTFANGKLSADELQALYPVTEFPNLWDADGNFLVDKITQIPALWAGSPRIFDIQYPIFGIPLMGYQAQVIPTLMVVAVAVQIEKLMRRISHESIAIISVPLVTIVLSCCLAFVIIGPIGYMLSLAIAEALRAIFVYTNFPGFGLGGAILGAVYAPIVVTGLHQGFLPIETQLLTSYGESWITPIACVSNVSQAFACLAGLIYVKSKAKKSLATSAFVSANLGITEPALFGVNITMKHFFIAGIIGSAVGGYWLGMTQTTCNSLGSASWLGLIQFDVSTNVESLKKWYEFVENATPWGKFMLGFGMPPIANVAIAMTAASLVSFTMANILSWTKSGRETLKEANGTDELPKFVNSLIGKLLSRKSDKVKEDISYVLSPVDGILYLPKNINDPVFNEEMMGKSFAIEVNSTKYDLHSPYKKGKIAGIFDTGHAVTVMNKKGNSILIHVGLDTAQLNLDAQNIRKLKFFKYHKLINSSVSNKEKSKSIVTVENNELIKNGAKDNKIFVALLNESVRQNQTIEVVASEGRIKKGEPIFKIVTR